MIQLLVGNTVTEIIGNVPSEIYQSLKQTLGYRPENAVHMARHNPYWENGVVSTVCYKGRCRCPIKRDNTHFPTGLLSKARYVFGLFNLPFQMLDTRGAVEITKQFTFGSSKPLRPYQQKIVDDAIRQQRGIVKLATGGGKTVVASALISALGVTPFIFYVPSQDLLRQAYAEIQALVLENGQNIKVGRVGAGFRDIQPVTVMTVQSAVRALAPEEFVTTDKNGKTRKKSVVLFTGDDEGSCKETEFTDSDDDLGDYRNDVRDYIHSCKGYISDECQHWASKTCQLISIHSYSARYRYGFSATPYRDAGDDILIDSCFGKPICDINASFLINEGFLVPPTIFFVPVNNMRGASFDGYADGYERGIVANDLRNGWISNIASNLSQQGRMILVLIKHIEHGNILNEMIPGSVFLHGSCTPSARQRHIDAMRNHKAPITIASSIFDEGVDVRPLDGLILAGGGKSPTRALQRVGRVIRPYSCENYLKKDAVVVDFDDGMKWMRQHSADRRRMYKTEPRFTIKDLKIA